MFVNGTVNKYVFYSCVDAVGKLLVDPSIDFRLFVTKHLLSIWQLKEDLTPPMKTPIQFFIKSFFCKTLKSPQVRCISSEAVKCSSVIDSFSSITFLLRMLFIQFINEGTTVGVDNGKCLSSFVCSQLDCRQCESDKMMTLFKTQT